MNDVIHVYCDESCHLEHDHQQAMVLGAIWCPASQRAALGREIKDLKRRYGLAPTFEIKWTKISPSRIDFYLALIDLFFDEPLLKFRAVIVPDKSVLDHQRFSQSHDDFYYKMWFFLLTKLVDNEHQFRVFLDIKDTRGREKIAKLHEVLCNKHHDFNRQRIIDIQQVHSHEVPLLQLTDILIGALSHFHRGLKGSTAKQAVIERIHARSAHNLQHSTAPWIRKFNLLIWKAQEAVYNETA